MVGFLGCKHTLPAHVQLFIHQYLQVLLSRAALNPFIPQPVLIPGVAPTQMQDLALGLVLPHEVHMGPPLQPVKVPLGGIPSLKQINCTVQLGVICHKKTHGILQAANTELQEEKYGWHGHILLRAGTWVLGVVHST